MLVSCKKCVVLYACIFHGTVPGVELGEGIILSHFYSSDHSSVYVFFVTAEQFDVQQPELNVRETVTFCARLRLDGTDPAVGGVEGKLRYVDHVLETMELTDIQNLQVGSYEEGGLTFEQRKRLAIACELAGSPSVLFLDEPTSGLDSRGALVVMRAMRRIADVSIVSNHVALCRGSRNFSMSHFLSFEMIEISTHCT